VSTPPYYQNTPPPAKSNSNGCLKAAGIGCAVVLLVGIIGTIFVAQKVKQALNDPKSGGIFGTAVNAGKTGAQGAIIRQAIVKYHDKTGAYPVTLSNLIPAYVPTVADMHAPTDANPDPKHVSWKYMRPSADAGPKTPLLKTAIVIEMGGQKAESDVVINLDGTSQSHSNAQGSYGGGQPGSSM
jgi:hypothetical protein